MRNFALPACLALLCGCSSLLSFDVNSSGTASIQGSPTGGLLGNALGGGFGGFNNFNVSQSQDFKNENTNKDHISECRVTRLTLKVLKPVPPAAGSDLSFLTQIDFFITAPNLPRLHIAGVKNPPVGQASVDLALDNVDIAAYAKSDTFSITTDAQGRAPASDTTIEADLGLNIHASLL
jgi:hypothetical protein